MKWRATILWSIQCSDEMFLGSLTMTSEDNLNQFIVSELLTVLEALSCVGPKPRMVVSRFKVIIWGEPDDCGICNPEQILEGSGAVTFLQRVLSEMSNLELV